MQAEQKARVGDEFDLVLRFSQRVSHISNFDFTLNVIAQSKIPLLRLVPPAILRVRNNFNTRTLALCIHTRSSIHVPEVASSDCGDVWAHGHFAIFLDATKQRLQPARSRL